MMNPLAVEVYRAAYASTDTTPEQAHEFALNVVYELGVKFGKSVDFPCGAR